MGEEKKKKKGIRVAGLGTKKGVIEHGCRNVQPRWVEHPVAA